MTIIIIFAARFSNKTPNIQLILKNRFKMKKFRILAFLLVFTMAVPTLLHAQIIKGEVFVGGNGTQVDGDECYGFRKFGVHAGVGALISITSFMDVGLEVLFNQKGAYKRDSINVHLGYHTGRYNLRLNYGEVPVMVYLTDKDRYSIGLGVSYGRVVGIKERINGFDTGIGIGDGHLHWKENNPNYPDISKVKDINELCNYIYQAGYSQTEDPETQVPAVIENSTNYSPHDFNICADIRIRIWEGLHAELRYQYSLVPIRTRLFYKDQNETLLMTDAMNGIIKIEPLQHQYNETLTLRVVYFFNERRSKANKENAKEE